MSAQERYNQLFQFNKELFNIVPPQYLASMLGMAPETLSRLRKRVWFEFLDICQVQACVQGINLSFKLY
jgi:hypothetical protein